MEIGSRLGNEEFLHGVAAQQDQKQRGGNDTAEKLLGQAVFFDLHGPAEVGPMESDVDHQHQGQAVSQEMVELAEFFGVNYRKDFLNL